MAEVHECGLSLRKGTRHRHTRSRGTSACATRAASDQSIDQPIFNESICVTKCVREVWREAVRTRARRRSSPPCGGDATRRQNLLAPPASSNTAVARPCSLTAATSGMPRRAETGAPASREGGTSPPVVLRHSDDGCVVVAVHASALEEQATHFRGVPVTRCFGEPGVELVVRRRWRCSRCMGRWHAHRAPLPVARCPMQQKYYPPVFARQLRCVTNRRGRPVRFKEYIKHARFNTSETMDPVPCVNLTFEEACGLVQQFADMLSQFEATSKWDAKRNIRDSQPIADLQCAFAAQGETFS